MTSRRDSTVNDSTSRRRHDQIPRSHSTNMINPSYPRTPVMIGNRHDIMLSRHCRQRDKISTIMSADDELTGPTTSSTTGPTTSSTTSSRARCRRLERSGGQPLWQFKKQLRRVHITAVLMAFFFTATGFISSGTTTGHSHGREPTPASASDHASDHSTIRNGIEPRTNKTPFGHSSPNQMN